MRLNDGLVFNWTVAPRMQRSPAENKGRLRIKVFEIL